jgi:hypothetical protein
MLGLWLGSAAFAASPQLHHLLHADSQNPNHYCLFTGIHQQSLLAVFGTNPTPAPPSATEGLPCCSDFQLLPAPDYLLSDGRAPPPCFLHTAVVG